MYPIYEYIYIYEYARQLGDWTLSFAGLGFVLVLSLTLRIAGIEVWGSLTHFALRDPPVLPSA